LAKDTESISLVSSHDGKSKLYRWLRLPAVYRDHCEPRMVREYLNNATGVFVEVGANDPTVGSQTWALESDGWTGLLVEPLAEKAAELRATRKAIVEEVACGPPDLHETEAVLHVEDRRSTLTVEGGDPGVDFIDSRYVPIRTLDSLIEKAGIDHVDFLSIDVEGYEAEVLKGTTLEWIRPRLFLIEDKARDWSVHHLMLAEGYKRVRRTGLNSWYVPKSVDFPLSLFGRLQLFKKYVLSVPFHRARYRIRIKQADKRHAKKAQA